MTRLAPWLRVGDAADSALERIYLMERWRGGFPPARLAAITESALINTNDSGGAHVRQIRSRAAVGGKFAENLAGRVEICGRCSFID